MNIKFEFKEKYTVDDLISIMRILRGENGCPWDREQNHHTIRNNFIEETYEAVEAIDTDNPELLREELGDVLLQIIFHSQMEEESGSFTFGDVANDICQKLIIRHPHVFGEVSVSNSGEVLSNWDRIKKETKGQETYTDTLLGVSQSLPALMRSEKVQKRAKRAGFDWKDSSGAISKISEETDEFKKAVSGGNKSEIEDELGDLIFSAVNAARFFDINPEEALTKSTNKFINRFSKVEKLAEERGINMKEESLEVLDGLWDEAKKCNL